LHYARHAFSGLKSIKKFGPPTFRFGPRYFECSGTGTGANYAVKLEFTEVCNMEFEEAQIVYEKYYRKPGEGPDIVLN